MAEQSAIEITKEIVIAMISKMSTINPEAVIENINKVHTVVLENYYKEPKNS